MDFINSIYRDLELILTYSKGSFNGFSNLCKSFLDEYKITNDINNFTITNFKEYNLNKTMLNDNHSENNPEYILYKSENDTTIENNYFYTYFYTLIISCCVIINWVSKVYDPAYFNNEGNIVFAKTIEEYYGVSWCDNSTMVNSIGIRLEDSNNNKDSNENKDNDRYIDENTDTDNLILFVGYNTIGFDYKYLAQRVGMYLSINKKETPFSTSRILNKSSQFNNLMADEMELYIPGRIAVDIYKYAKSLNFPSSNLI
ncbi:hypothetical protein H8356DRAFT_1423518 [Neocallimastix lanati (nom. inval.)]|nr:hypothetical protein H8356DRAFT_1423518 [Neocallimastix sp. JGI-2020a]